MLEVFPGYSIMPTFRAFVVSRAPVLLAFLVTLLKLIYFAANRNVHRGHRLTALIGGYQFVCSGNVPDNSSVLKSRGGEMGRERVVGVVDVG